jgi:GNAT superfamily N-acetyltransferase
VERLTTYAELNPEELQELTSFWHPKQAHRDIRERFAQGASLWLIRSGGKLAGYGWTLQGRTIAPYFLRLGENDVSLFDFYAFPNFRGRAIHWILIAHILARLRAEGKARAFGDTAEWNQAQLASFKMTPFRPLGLACSFTIFGHTFVSWTKNKPMEFMQKDARRRNEAPTLAMLHER